MSAYRYLTIALLIAGSIACPALAAESANEARAINQQVLGLIKTSNLDEAEGLAKKGLLLCDDAGDVKVFCASQLNESLGDIEFARKQYPAALTYFEQSLRIREAGLGRAHALVSRSLLRVGRTHLTLKHMTEAETFVGRAVLGFEKLPVNVELATALSYLRSVYLDTDREDDAVSAARRELKVYEALGDSKAISTARINLSAVLLRQAQKLEAGNNFPDAEKVLVRAIQAIDPPSPEGEKTFSILLSQLGHLYERQGRYAESEPFMLRALEHRSKVAGPADADMRIILSNLVLLYGKMARPEDTVTYGLRAAAWYNENKQQDSMLGFVLLNLGRAQGQLGRFADAEAALLRSRDVLDRFLAEGDPQRISVRIEIGGLCSGQENFGCAEQSYRSALEIEPKLSRPATGWRSSLLAYLGMVYRERGLYPEAGRLLSEAVRLDEAGGNERSQFVGLRLIELASVFRRENRYGEAEAALLRALTLQPPELDRASALNALGVIYTTTDRYERAETVLQEALAIRSKRLAANNFFIAETIGNLATIDTWRGHYTEAEAKMRHVLDVIEALDQSRFTNAALYSSLLAQTLVSEGKLDEADTLIRRALELFQRRLGPDHPRFGGALKTLASIEAVRGRDRDAENHYQRALAIDEKTVGPQSPAVAGDLMNLVPLLKRAGKQRDAKAAIERALAINVAQFGADSPMTAGAVLASASMAYEVGQHAEARRLADRARQLQERAFGPEHYAMAGNWIFAARLAIAQGNLDDADNSMDRATQIVAKALPSDHRQNIDVLEGKADVARALGRLSDAEQYARDALAIAEKLFEPDYPVRRNAIDRLTGALWVQGKFADAERLQRDELGDIELKRSPDHSSTAIAARGVANVLGSSGRQGEAIKLYRRALAIDERSFGPQSDRAAWDHLALGSLLRRMGQFEDARIEINLAKNAWESQGRVLAANSSLEQLALLALGQGSPAEGVVFLERMLNVAEQTFGADSPALAAVLAQLGSVYVVAGRNDDAGKILARIKNLIGDNPPEQAPGYLSLLQLRAQLSAEHGKFGEAEADFTRAIAIATKYGGPQNSTVGNTSFNLAAAYLKAGRFREAIDYYVKALDIFKRENGDRAPVVGYTLIGASQAYEKIGDQKSAKALSAAAIEILGPTIAAQRPQPRWL